MTEYPLPQYNMVCERDGFPMLKIGGRLECVAEYLHRCIGQQPVVDMVRHGGTTYYVFEDGHQLPLLCSCCGGPLTVDDIESERQTTRGRRLVAMSIGSLRLQDGREVPEFVLEFSDEWQPLQRTQVPVAFKVAARLHHPAQCPHRPRPEVSPARDRRLKRRRRR